VVDLRLLVVSVAAAPLDIDGEDQERNCMLGAFEDSNVDYSSSLDALLLVVLMAVETDDEQFQRHCLLLDTYDSNYPGICFLVLPNGIQDERPKAEYVDYLVSLHDRDSDHHAEDDVAASPAAAVKKVVVDRRRPV
jgi:hypothetical protein